MNPTISRSDEAPAYWFLDILWILLATAEQTGGRFTVMEQLMPAGSGPPPHIHPNHDEWFYVMAGTLDMRLGERSFSATPGQSIFIPRGTVHAFTVTVDECRVLNGFTPAAMDAIILEVARPADHRGLPPRGLDSDNAKLARFANNDIGHTV